MKQTLDESMLRNITGQGAERNLFHVIIFENFNMPLVLLVLVLVIITFWDAVVQRMLWLNIFLSIRFFLRNMKHFPLDFVATNPISRTAVKRNRLYRRQSVLVFII